MTIILQMWKLKLRENSDLPYFTELDLGLDQELASFFMYRVRQEIV